MSDLISRQALKDAMYHEAFETDTEMQRWDSGCWIRYKLFENVIENLPSAERKGKWVVRHPMRYDGKFVGADTDPIPDTRIRHLYCGECDKQMPIFEKFPYCPYCGAPMEGEEE